MVTLIDDKTDAILREFLSLELEEEFTDEDRADVKEALIEMGTRLGSKTIQEAGLDD